MAGKELVVPSWLQAKIDEGAVKADASKLVTTVDSVPRISLKSRRFNFIENGDVVHKEHEQIHVVVVGVQPDAGMAKTFYAGSYEPGDSSPPDCSSYDGVRPDSWISQPQAEMCSTCPNNKWGSAKSMSGKKAKACRDSKRLIVINAKNIGTGTAFMLNVTVASLKALSDYGKQLAKQGLPIEAVITTISIDEDSDFSKLNFAAAGVMNEEQGMLAITRASEKEWESEVLPTAPAITNQSTPSPATLPIAEQPVTPPATEGEVIPAATAAPAATEEDVDELISGW